MTFCIWYKHIFKFVWNTRLSSSSNSSSLLQSSTDDFHTQCDDTIYKHKSDQSEHGEDERDEDDNGDDKDGDKDNEDEDDDAKIPAEQRC